MANLALEQAERAFQENRDSYRARDLAYIAERKAQTAEAVASITIEQKNQTRANRDYQAAQGKIVMKMKRDLGIVRAELAKLAAIKEEPRGMVITLSERVLFASNEAILLPEAQSRLDRVVDVLFAVSDRDITIEGHTDSVGSDSDNLSLSQGRADAVRNYLVRRGCQANRIEAHGLGEGHPIADNMSAEGRADNRRVEIIIESESYTFNR